MEQWEADLSTDCARRLPSHQAIAEAHRLIAFTHTPLATRTRTRTGTEPLGVTSDGNERQMTAPEERDTMEQQWN